MAVQTVQVDFSGILQNAENATGTLRVRLSQVGTVEDEETGQQIVIPITWQEQTLSSGSATLELIPNAIISPACTYYDVQFRSIPACVKDCAKLLLSGVMYVPDYDCSVMDILISPPSPESANTASGWASQAKQAAEAAKGYAIEAGNHVKAVQEAEEKALEDISDARSDALTAINEQQAASISAVQAEADTQITNIDAEGAAQVLRVTQTGDDYVADMEGLKADAAQSESNAAASAQAAAISAMNAAASAQNAKTSETNAASSEEDAAQSAEVAEQYIRSVTMAYLGAVATVADLPASGADEQAFYYVTATGKQYVYQDGAWTELQSYAWIIYASEKPEDSAELNALYARLYDGGLVIFGNDDNINPQYPYTTAERVFFTPGEYGEQTTVKEALDLAIDGISVNGRIITVTRTDGTSFTISTQDTTYGNATQTEAGLMSAADKAKLDGIEDNANDYVHPSHTAHASGFYKVTVDNEGHVSAASNVQKSDITGLGIPDGSEATTTAAGLMSAADKLKLDGIEAGANKNVYAAYATVASAEDAASVDMSGLSDGGIMIVTITE